MLVATVTPAAPVIASTPTPANAATAVMRAAEATLSALTVGTYTPVPLNAGTPTPEATETPLPLLIPVTPPATATPTPVLPGQLPRQLAGKILFFSDRDGQARLYALDPATGQTLWVTQNWPYLVAQARLGRSPDGKMAAYAENDNDRVPHILVRDEAYSSARQITFGKAWSYDPAWSPPGDLIAFVSQEPGNDEIYTIRPDGSDMRRLTSQQLGVGQAPVLVPRRHADRLLVQPGDRPAPALGDGRGRRQPAPAARFAVQRLGPDLGEVVEGYRLRRLQRFKVGEVTWNSWNT